MFMIYFQDDKMMKNGKKSNWIVVHLVWQAGIYFFLFSSYRKSDDGKKTNSEWSRNNKETDTNTG